MPTHAASPDDALPPPDALSLTLSRAAEAAADWPLAEASARVVLLIEDNADHRYVYAQVLARAGFQVEVAVTGADGIARARAVRPDVVLVDVMLPDTDGWHVTTALKADPATAAIPVLVVSVRAFAHDHARSLAAGAARHLDKPAAPYAVVDAVCGLLPPRDDATIGLR